MFKLPAEAVLTRRDFVNTWECDENHHWNVRFYSRAFEHAFEAAAAFTGTSPLVQREAGFVRHIRYHSEMRASQRVEVHSARLGGEGGEPGLVHFLTDGDHGRLCATAIDRTAGRDLPLLAAIESAAAEPAQPRGIAPGGDATCETAGMIDRDRAIISNIGAVRVVDVDHAGRLLLEMVVSRFSDGAAHLWGHAGIGEEWLSRSGHGRVAVEMKLTVVEGASPGDVLRLVTWMGDTQEKTFSIRHQLEHAVSGRVAACGSVRALIMDLSTRKAAPLPRELRDYFHRIARPEA